MAERLLSGSAYSLVIADLSLNGSQEREGLDIIRTARTRCARTTVVMLTAYGSPEVENCSAVPPWCCTRPCR
jgi:CheY-like chemotaxis protein